MWWVGGGGGEGGSSLHETDTDHSNIERGRGTNMQYISLLYGKKFSGAMERSD